MRHAKFRFAAPHASPAARRTHMLTLNQEGWSLPLGDIEPITTWNARADTSRPLSEFERSQLVARSGGYWMVLTALLLAAAAVGSLVLPFGFGGEVAFVAAGLVFMLSLNFPIAENRGRYVRDDIELGVKVLASGRVASMRVAGGKLRPYCVLTLIGDKTPASAIEFKVPRSAYTALQKDRRISVWYVPASGIVMELSTASYRYRLSD